MERVPPHRETHTTAARARKKRRMADLLLLVPPIKALHDAITSVVDSVTQSKRASFLDSQPADEFLGRHGRLRYFTSKRGARLCGYYWPSESATGVVMLCHGCAALFRGACCVFFTAGVCGACRRRAQAAAAPSPVTATPILSRQPRRLPVL